MIAIYRTAIHNTVYTYEGLYIYPYFTDTVETRRDLSHLAVTRVVGNGIIAVRT